MSWHDLKKCIVCYCLPPFYWPIPDDNVALKRHFSNNWVFLGRQEDRFKAASYWASHTVRKRVPPALSREVSSRWNGDEERTQGGTSAWFSELSSSLEIEPANEHKKSRLQKNSRGFLKKNIDTEDEGILFWPACLYACLCPIRIAGQWQNFNHGPHELESSLIFLITSNILQQRMKWKRQRHAYERLEEIKHLQN